jgi:hypothetical protein
MNAIDIVMLFAIILFARLAFRLLRKYIEMKKNNKDKND